MTDTPNSGTVSVSRELLQQWLDDIGESRHVTQYSAKKREQLRAILAQPAEQQDEPVAVMYENGTVLSKADCGNVFDICCRAQTPLYRRPAVQAVRLPDVDKLSNIIRQVDGNHSLGAGALAEKILDAVAKLNGIEP